MVDIQNLFNMRHLNYEHELNFQLEEFSHDNITFMAINETIDIKHRGLGHIGRNRARYMKSEASTALPHSDTNKFYSKHVLELCFRNAT